MEYHVTADLANPDTLYDVLARHPRVTAQFDAPAAGHGFPSYTFRGPLSALVDMLRNDWDDGSDDPLAPWIVAPAGGGPIPAEDRHHLAPPPFRVTADSLTEDEPRTLPTLAWDALDVTERAGAIARALGAEPLEPTSAAVTGALAFQVTRLARQVAELAQRVERLADELDAVDGTGPFDPPDPRDDALDQIAAALNEPDPDGWDVGIMDTIQAIIIGTGRPCVDVVDAWNKQHNAD